MITSDPLPLLDTDRFVGARRHGGSADPPVSFSILWMIVAVVALVQDVVILALAEVRRRRSRRSRRLLLHTRDITLCKMALSLSSS